jgi:hypothetical protein
MASTRGRCPKCRFDYADLWDHLAKKHKSVLWTPADLRGTTLLACPCGAVARSDHGLKSHQGKIKCIGLQQRHVATAGAGRPSARRTASAAPSAASIATFEASCRWPWSLLLGRLSATSQKLRKPPSRPTPLTAGHRASHLYVSCRGRARA